MLESNPLPAPKLGTTADPAGQEADVLVTGLTQSGELSPTLGILDQKTDGWIARLVKLKQIRGKRGEVTMIASPLRTGPTMLLVVGLGDEPASRALAFQSASTAIRTLSDRARANVIVALGECFPDSIHDEVVSGVLFGCENQAIYQTDPALEPPGTITFSGLSEVAVQRGMVIGQSVNQTRRLVNEPPAVIYPESFAAVAEEMASKFGLSIEVWDDRKLEAEGCRAILAVGRGSSRPSRLVIMRHQGGGDEPPIALVGKGVTFDSGGLSLKPSEGMADMKCDMAGAATVLGTMQAIAGLGVKKNVIGLCGLAENMVSGDSYKLGDVIETRSGKTIEILNTDAEGRVVLADTLNVAVQYQPRSIVDLATLTGACVVALGTDVVGMMTNDQLLCDSIEASATETGEPAWQLPMFQSFDEKIKSKVADIRNIGEGRWGGAITAAKFLENFVGDAPWVHLDIAGPAFAESPKPYRDAGATGVMVRTLVHWIESQ